MAWATACGPIGWWTEASPSSVAAFALYSVTATVGLIVAYWTLSRWPLMTFTPSLGEHIISGGIVVAFLVVVVLTQQLVAVLVLVPLMVLTLLLLARNRNAEQDQRVMTQLVLAHPKSWGNLFALMLIPVVATGMYALALTMRIIWPINILWYVITMPLGFICFLLAAFRSLRTPVASTMTLPHTI